MLIGNMNRRYWFVFGLLILVLIQGCTNRQRQVDTISIDADKASFAKTPPDHGRLYYLKKQKESWTVGNELDINNNDSLTERVLVNRKGKSVTVILDNNADLRMNRTTCFSKMEFTSRSKRYQPCNSNFFSTDIADRAVMEAVMAGVTLGATTAYQTFSDKGFGFSVTFDANTVIDAAKSAGLIDGPGWSAQYTFVARNWVISRSNDKKNFDSTSQQSAVKTISEPQVGPTGFPLHPINVHFNPSQQYPDDIAVIIGNANYEKGKDIPNVTPAYADAEGIKNYVKQALGIREENVIFLKDSTQAEMTATFGSETNPKGQLFNFVKAGKSRVFVYYSGHGAPGGEEGSSYLVPSNAQASLIDLNGYSLKTLYKNLSKIPAKSVTVVLEACFSGASQSGSGIAKASPIYLKAKETGVPPNITVIAAGAANQIASWEQDSSSGLFTKYFLKGMSGEADAKPYGNGDGKVGYDELGRYFKETLTYYARRYYGREQTAQIVVGSGG